MIDPRYYQLATYLWRGSSYAYYWVPDDGQGQKYTYWFAVDPQSIPEVPKYLLNKDCYFGVNGSIIRRSEHERARAKDGDITAINCLYADIDAGSNKRFATIDEALAHVKQLPLRPSAIIKSGGGLQCYWLLKHTQDVNANNQVHLEELQDAWGEFVGGDDGAKDLARVLRIPGTKNLKPHFSPNFPTVTIETFDMALQYSLSEIEPYLEPIIAAKAARRTPNKAHSQPQPHSGGTVGLDDQALLDALFRCQNGDLYRRLWDGDLSPARGDHSKADQMLCNGLAWVTGRDTFRMDGLFRQSGLMRDKWADRDDYRDRTLTNAADSAQTIYDPRHNGYDPAAVAAAQSAVGLGGSGTGTPPPSGGGTGGSGGPASTGASGSQPKPTGKQAAHSTYADIGREYIRIHADTIYSRSQWLRYAGGVWSGLHDLAVTREMWALVEIHDNRPSLKAVGNVESFVRAHVYTPEERLDNDALLINLRNGTYSLDLQALLSHHPGLYLTTQLPFDHDPAAACPNWLHYLETTFVDRAGQTDPELIAFIQEAMGYSLTTDIHYHATFWCYGEGANGKGVLFYVLEQLAGSSAIPFNVDLLRREQYQLADLAGKRIALCPEADSNGVVEDAVIKALVAGDSLQVRQIRREPFTLHPVVKLWWSMNKLPTITDSSTGMWRRIKLIPFLADFEGRDKHKRIDNLRELLKDELPGIFNWAMEGLARLTAQGEFSRVKQIEEWTALYRRESNTVLTFIDETCDVDRAYNVGSNLIYTRYKDWCSDNGYKPYNVRNFKTEMERLGYYHRRTMTARVFDGLRLKGQGNTIP